MLKCKLPLFENILGERYTDPALWPRLGKSIIERG